MALLRNPPSLINRIRVEWRPGQGVFHTGEWMQEFEQHPFVINDQLQQPLLDKLHPHSCRNPDCSRILYFNELIMAHANQKIKQNFKKNIFEYLIEHYNQFTFLIRVKWAEVWGEFEFRQYLRKLWKNKNVKFYCCYCAKKAEHGEIQDNGRIVIKERIQNIFYGEPVHLQIERTQEQERVDLQVRQDMLDALTLSIRQNRESLENDICEGTGFTREELFGGQEDD